MELPVTAVLVDETPFAAFAVTPIVDPVIAFFTESDDPISANSQAVRRVVLEARERQPE